MFRHTFLQNKYKTVILIVGVTLFPLIQINLFSQNKVFTLLNPVSEKSPINKSFTESTQISPFKSYQPISGLAISCDINFYSDSSLVRLTLLNDRYDEFLIGETYPLLSGSYEFSLDNYAEETALLEIFSYSA